MSDHRALFGAGLGAWNGADVAQAADVIRLAEQADRGGLDLVAIADHPYFGDKLDAYATLAFLLGHTARITAVVTVTNLPSRPAPVLARTVTSLSALSRGRMVLGIGAGGAWDEIVKLGVPRLGGRSAVRAVEEAITLIRALSGGGDPVTFDGQAYHVSNLPPAPVAAPPVWTGAIGPKSLAITGKLADGWIPGYASDWQSPLYRESRPIIDQAAAAAGRDPAAIATIYNFGGRITSAPLAATRDQDGRWIGGSAKQWVDELTAAVLDHHATGFIFRSKDDVSADVALGQWAHEIAPAVRDAIAHP